MKWLLYEQHDSPTVAAFWTARVGSVNERPGITGISHFHEHMMFKGTYSMGIKPGTLQKDLDFDRQIDALYAQIAAEEAGITQANVEKTVRETRDTGLRRLTAGGKDNARARPWRSSTNV